MWWFFRRRREEKKKKREHVMRKFVAGFVIGGAIASVIGKKMLDDKEE